MIGSAMSLIKIRFRLSQQENSQGRVAFPAARTAARLGGGSYTALHCISKDGRRLFHGSTPGFLPSSTAGFRFASPSYARSISHRTFSVGLLFERHNLRPAGALGAFPGRPRERHGWTSLSRQLRNLGVPASLGLS